MTETIKGTPNNLYWVWYEVFELQEINTVLGSIYNRSRMDLLVHQSLTVLESLSLHSIKSSWQLSRGDFNDVKSSKEKTCNHKAANNEQEKGAPCYSKWTNKFVALNQNRANAH